MKKERIFKISIDIAMIVFIFIVMAYQLIGNKIHEIIGILTFILFIILNVLNRNWYKALFKGRYTVCTYY